MGDLWKQGTDGTPTTRSLDTAGGSVDAAKQKARTASKESQGTQDYRKKKKDALEGKDAQKARGNEPDREQGRRGRDSAKKEEGSRSGKSSAKDSQSTEGRRGGGKSGGSSGSGPRSGPQNLQSGQTTVQFSSGDGGGMATALGSLLALFSSSASMIRAETGANLAVSSQTTLGNLRYVFQVSTSQTNGSSGGGKSTGNVNLSSDQAAIVDLKLNLEGEGGTSSRGGGGSGNSLAGLLSNIKFGGGETAATEGEGFKSTIVLEGLGGALFVTVNASNTFFSPNTQFAFSNLPSPQYSGVIGNYFAALGLPTSSSYTYKVLGPVLADTPPSTGGITINNSITTTVPGGTTTAPLGSTELSVTAAPQPITLSALGAGLTIDTAGNVYVNLTSPISVLLQATSSNTILPIRINAGPGAEVTKSSLYSATMFGLSDPTTHQFQPTVFRDGTEDGNTGKTTIVGSGEGITISNGAVNYYTATPTAGIFNTGFSIPSTGGAYTYVFPSNTIFRHVGQSLDPTSANSVPTEAAYGNFSAYAPEGAAPTGNTIFLPQAPLFYDLTLGGNVLDVFGTKYGVGDALTIVLPPATPITVPAPGDPLPPPLPANAITLGGNTLAGFGPGYGDLQTLTISAVAGDSAATVGPTNIMFRGNELAVDKNIGSTLYTHLQTLDMQNYLDNGMVTGSPSNVHIVFKPSIIEGNTGSDTFYGSIQKLSANTAGSYNGFVDPVTVTRINGQVVTTTADGNNNSIAWAADIYGQSSIASTTGPNLPDTYVFSLLLDKATKAPVMPGDPLLTNFGLTTSQLVYEITPSIFRAISGAASEASHNKTINVSDLNALVTATPFTFDPASPVGSSPSALSLEMKYLAQRFPGQTLKGVTIQFDGTMGGSLRIIANEADTALLLSKELSAIKNLSFVLANYDTKALVAALPTVNTPLQTPFYIYEKGPIVNPVLIVGPYYYELDNFFANSLFATYSVSGTGVTSGSGNVTYPIDPGTTVYTIGTGVTIDKFGTISVAPTATAPILMPLTFTATQHPGGDFTVDGNVVSVSPGLFGFLHAPITKVGNNGSSLGQILQGSNSNIIIGGANSTLIGEPLPTLAIQATGTSYTTLPLGPYGSNLIVSTAGGATAYGDFQAVTMTAKGTGGLDAATAPVTPGGAIIGQTFDFNPNAFYVVNGTVYGVSQTFDITAQGAPASAGDTLVTTNPTSSGSGGNGNGNAPPPPAPLSLIDSGLYNGNTVNFGAQTFYGSGKIDGNGQGFAVSVMAGTGKLYVSTTDTSLLNSTTSYGTLDVSGQVKDNTFIFNPVKITVQGDTAATLNVISPYNEGLSITVQPTFAKITTTNEVLATSAIFSGNHFIFKSVTIDASKALGNTTIDADIDLLGNNSSYAYKGFINEVNVSDGTGGVVITTTDGLNNSMTFGNKTFTLGTGSLGTVIEFDLLADTSGNLVMMGHDTITNLNSTSQIRFHLAPATNIFIPTPEALDSKATFSHVGGNTVIHFLGGGGLTLNGVNITSFLDWGSANGSLTIGPAASHSPIPALNPLPSFDPVFLSGVSQPDAFAGFINGNPDILTYGASTPLPGGITLAPNGTFTVNAADPLDANIEISALYYIPPSLLPIPPIKTHIFAINAPFINYDSDSSHVINGTQGTPGAFEVMAGTVYGNGGGSGGLVVSSGSSAPVVYKSNLIYNMSTVDHTIFGNVIKITNMDVSGVALDMSRRTYAFNGNLMNINTGSSGLDKIYGTAGSLILDAPTLNSNKFELNEFDFGTSAASLTSFIGNTIYGSGSIFGNVEIISFTASAAGEIKATTVNLGGNNLTSGVYLSGSSILTPATGVTSLYAGIKEFDMIGSASHIDSNALIFSGSTLTGVGSTIFHNDIDDLSQTSFYSAPVIASYSGGAIQVTGNNNNLIVFGNNIMNAATGIIDAATGETYHNNFNLDLMVNGAGNLVTEGHTTINNFGAANSPSNPNMLNLQLSGQASSDILADTSSTVQDLIVHQVLTTGINSIQGFVFITPAALSAYMQTHNGLITSSQGTSTINFSDPANPAGNDFGSITLNDGVSMSNNLTDLGTNIAVTAFGVTTIATSQNSANDYNILVPGNTLGSYSQDTHILNLSGNQIVDFTGEVQIHLTNELFAKLGLSDGKTAVENAQTFLNSSSSVNTPTGGVAPVQYFQDSTSSKLTAVLTFESSGVSHGSISLHNLTDPLVNHLLITHS